MIRLPAWAALVLAAFAPGTAAAASPSAAVAAFERFIGTSAPICSRQPSAACVEVGWSFTDADRSGELSLREFEAVKTALSNWTIWRDDNVNAREQSSIALGLWVIEMIGLDTLFHSYDEDHSGGLSRAELLVDVRLDERPLGTVLGDPDSVDMKAMAARVEAMAALIEGLLSQGAATN